MLVKSKIDSRKVFKNFQYKTDYINGISMRVMTQDGVYLGYYNVSDFSMPNGGDITIQRYNNIQNDIEVKKGDIVVCDTDSYKYLIKGGKYKVDNVFRKVSSFGTVSYSVTFEGYSRKLNFNSWKFKKLSVKESRKLTIDQIFNKEENFSVEFTRKFEQVVKKEEFLMSIISKSILDKNRHNLGVIEWGIKISKDELKLSDFDEILDMKLSDILKILD